MTEPASFKVNSQEELDLIVSNLTKSDWIRSDLQPVMHGKAWSWILSPLIFLAKKLPFNPYNIDNVAQSLFKLHLENKELSTSKTHHQISQLISKLQLEGNFSNKTKELWSEFILQNPAVLPKPEVLPSVQELFIPRHEPISSPLDSLIPLAQLAFLKR